MKTLLVCCAFFLAGLGIPADAQNIWPPESEIAAVAGTRMTSISKERFREGKWEEVNREVFVYDDEGYLIEKHFSSLMGDEWRVTRREKFSYADGVLVGVLKEDKRINVFHPTEQRTYSYDENRLSNSTIDAYGPGAQVIPVFRHSHQYTSEDSVTTETIVQEQSINGEWKQISTVRRVFDEEGRPTLQSKSDGAGSEAEAGERFTYEYDEDGQLIGRRWSFRGEDGWIVPSDERYVYLEDGTIIVESLRSLGGETTRTHRIVLEHDSSGNVVSRLYQGWKDGEWLDGRRELFSYEME